ncbi:MAG: hypothetical protein ABFS12_16735 [Bacteroidota bacterium]
MKTSFRLLSITSSIVLAIAILSCTTQPPVEEEEKYSLEGVWKLVSGEWTIQDTLITFPGSEMQDLKSIKYLGKINWANVAQDTTMDMHWAHAGIYRVTEDTYVEHFEIHNNTESIGDSAVFKYTLDGDKWTISSDWLKEEWKRIE